MKCPICGSNNRTGIRFCKYCGAPLGNPENDVLNESAPIPQPAPIPQDIPVQNEKKDGAETAPQPGGQTKSKKMTVVLIAAVGAALLVTAVFLTLLLSGVLRFSNDTNRADSNAAIETSVTTPAVTATVPVTAADTSAETQAQMVKVPDVVGLNRSDAITRITDAGFTISVQEDANTNVANGFVISQSPSGGKSAEPGSAVTVYVSSKKEEATAAVSSNTSAKYLYCRASEFVTLRKSPSRSAEEIVKITTREKVEYLGTDGEFYYVSYKGKKGYALAKFFSEDPSAPLNYDDN